MFSKSYILRLTVFFVLYFGLTKETYQRFLDVCDTTDTKCKRTNIFGNFGTIHDGKRSNGKTLVRKQQMSLLECVKECLVTTRCDAINYRKIWNLCELVESTFIKDEVEDKECMYSVISTWPKTLAGKCKDHNCAIGEKCQMLKDGVDVECIKSYCTSSIPTINNASIVDKFGISRDLATVFRIKCKENFHLIGKPYLLCNGGGIWEKMFCCVPKDYPLLVLKGKYPKDCNAIPSYCGNGVYKISPKPTVYFEVYCLMENNFTGSNWHVLQHRKNGSVSFERSWKEYEDGFGDIRTYGDFWLGNKKIHYLTSIGNNNLEIDVDIYTESFKRTWYTYFSVGDASSKYKLTINGYDDKDIINSVGIDSMAYHSGWVFSTDDQDNDLSRDNCAEIYHGGWWYKDCFHANLNGDIKLNGTRYQGIQWGSLGLMYSLKTSRMMVTTNGDWHV